MRLHSIVSVLCIGWCGASAAIAQASQLAQPADASVVELQLTDFFKRPVGARGLELNEALKQADGSRVRLTGYMVAREDATPGRFQLAPRPVRLSEHADGEADDLPPATVTVLLDPSQAQRIVLHQPKPVTLIGRLLIGRSEEPGGRVSWFRLQLDSQALAANGLPPLAGALPRHP
jgi:hypothetical protein